MKIEYAIENLSKTLKYDSQAKYLNEIITWINNQKAISINENLLFAKMFIHKLNDIKQHDFEANVTKLNQRAMTDILKLPLDEYYKELTSTLNTNRLNTFLESHGIEVKHPSLRDEKEILVDSLKLGNIKESEINEFKKHIFEVEEVKDRVNNMLSTALNKYQ